MLMHARLPLTIHPAFVGVVRRALDQVLGDIREVSTTVSVVFQRRPRQRMMAGMQAHEAAKFDDRVKNAARFHINHEMVDLADFLATLIVNGRAIDVLARDQVGFPICGCSSHLHSPLRLAATRRLPATSPAQLLLGVGWTSRIKAKS